MRPQRGDATRDVILDTAERLYAERGIHTVSNRQIGEQAEQGNTAAVTYHFGTKADLVRAIAARHAEQLERIRVSMVVDAAGSTDVRDWVACLVRPFARHLAELGSPTWYARFCVQVTSDPALHEIITEQALTSPALRMLLVGLNQCLSDLPAAVREERSIMAGHLIAQMAAEQERVLAAGGVTLHPSWEAVADSLIDALVGLLLAPVTPRS
jgi:AcrR family transcriptional regulator